MSSRQYAFQIRQMERGLCAKCARKLETKRLCSRHAEMDRLRKRKKPKKSS